MSSLCHVHGPSYRLKGLYFTCKKVSDMTPWFHPVFFHLWKLQVIFFTESTLCLQSESIHLFFPHLKKSSFLKFMLLLNFPIQWSSHWKKIIKIITWWYLNGYYSMIFIQCYYKISTCFDEGLIFCELTCFLELEKTQ